MDSIQTACQYLFNQPASTIFTNTPEELVNKSLECLIKVNVHFLSREKNDGFFFVGDPSSFNNQCHIYSLFAAQIREGYKEKSLEEKLSYTQENRFFHLCFLLSFIFLKERSLLCRAIDKSGVELPFSEKEKKTFSLFVKDSLPGCQGVLLRTARQALNALFKELMQQRLSVIKDEKPLYSELYKLSLENLDCKSEDGKSSLYTLPKLIGVAYLIQQKIPFIIRSKIFTEKGVGKLFYQSPLVKEVKENGSVLIFEAIGSDTFSMQRFREMASKCSHYFERHISSKNRHKDNEKCLFCKQEEMDTSVFKEFEKRFEKAITLEEELLYVVAADFMNELQMPFLKFFQNEQNYPELKKVYEKAVPHIKNLGLSMEEPLTFTIKHVYADDKENAFSQDFYMDYSPEELLTKRGVL